MKNIMSYLIVIFSLLSFSQAQAQSCETKTPVNINQLKFIGMSLLDVRNNADIKSGYSCRVVKGGTDGEAKANGCKCVKGGNEICVNPGNPQYISGHGDSPTTNRLGYYFCMTGFSKKAMCNYMKREKKDTLIIEYTGSQNSNDGNCMCRAIGADASQAFECTTEKVEAMENATTCDVSGATLVHGKCVCSTDNNIEAKQGTVCPPVQPTPVSPTATVKDEDFAGCFTDIETASAACSQAGQDAFDKCSKNAPENNKNISEAQRVLSIGLDALVAKNAGTGALEACAKMSATGTGVIEALSLFQKTCRGELDKCKKGCEDVKAYSQEETAKLAEACAARYEAKNPGSKWTKEHQTQFALLADKHKAYAVNVEKFCKGDAQVAEGQFDDMLQRLAESVQKADICRCQLTAANVNPETCDSIVTPLTCMQNINQPGCSFSSVGCPPGSTAVNCRSAVTQINPNGSGLKAPPSGFAGPGFGSAGSGGTAGGKVQVGDGDLSGLYDETRPTGSGTATADAGSPFTPAAPGGAPGVSVNMGGGDGAGNGANGEGSEKGGLSGFFQNAKGAISSMFGGGSGDKGVAAKTPNSKAYKNDVNGFRPKAPALRGMANASEFGGKNRDIWKIMNQRYNDQYHTFITVENPSK